MAWRRLWQGVGVPATISPLLFLAAMGLGLGELVDEGTGGVDGVDYLEFVAPGPDGRERMMQAAGESLWPVLGGREVDAHVPRHGRDAGRARATLFGGYVHVDRACAC